MRDRELQLGMQNLTNQLLTESPAKWSPIKVLFAALIQLISPNGSLSSIATVSNSIPKNVRVLTGRTVFPLLMGPPIFCKLFEKLLKYRNTVWYYPLPQTRNHQDSE